MAANDRVAAENSLKIRIHVVGPDSVWQLCVNTLPNSQIALNKQMSGVFTHS